MPDRPQRARPRPWIFAWLLLLAGVWLVGLSSNVALLRWARTSHAMCAGLPDYRALSPGLAKAGPIGFLTDAPAPADMERFFCAQYQLSPKVLVRRRGLSLTPGTGSDSALIVDLIDRAAVDNVLRELASEAQHRGMWLDRHELPNGLAVVRAGSGP